MTKLRNSLFFSTTWRTLAVAALVSALSACSDSPEVEKKTPAVIGFSNNLDNISRSLTDDSFHTFYVTGGYWNQINPWNTEYVQVFTARRVFQQSPTFWDYENHEPWLEGNYYKFYAIGVEGDDEQLSVDFSTKQTYIWNSEKGSGKMYYIPVISELTVDDSFQKDIVFAESDEILGLEQGANKPVQLAFKHILSRLSVTFEYTGESSDKVEVSDVKLTHFYNKSAYNYLNNVSVDWSPWPISEDRKTTELNFKFGDEYHATVKGQTETSEAFVIPFDYTNGYATGMGSVWRVTLSYTVTINGSQSTKSIEFDPTWVEGKAYNYTVQISNKSKSNIKLSKEHLY